MQNQPLGNPKLFPEPDSEINVDVVVIGGGPNGLICAAYLARAGLSVAVLERRQEAGGGLATEEILFPGVWANTHATYHMMVDYMPVLTDFDFKSLGLTFVKPNAQAGMLLPNNESLLLCRSLQDTADEIAKFSLRDSRVFAKKIRVWQRMVDELLAPATYYPPIPPIEFAVNLNRTRIGKELLEISEKSPLEVITDTFSDDRVRALFLYISCMWGLDPYVTGLGFMVPLLASRSMNKCLCLGGSHKFAGSLAKTIIKNGGMIWECSEATKILMENGRVKGVETHEGRRFYAHAVASSLPPPDTFGRLIGQKDCPTGLFESAKKWKWDKWSFFTTHLALNEPPRYAGRDPRIEEAFLNILGISSVDDVLALSDAAQSNGPPMAAGHATTESVLDHTLCRANGKHSAFFQVIAPYGIKDGWDKRKLDVENALIEAWRAYAGNLDSKNIVMRTSESPEDIERRIPCMRQGAIKHGDYNSLQMGYFRPNDLCSASATPIEGLYLCGASTYPGGLILGGPGYIAANAVARDLSVAPWWKMPEGIRRYVETYL